MSYPQFIACAPLLFIALTVVVELLLISFSSSERAAALVAALGLVLAGATLGAANAYAPTAVSPLLVIDRFALFYIALVLIAGLGTIALAYRYFPGSGGALYVLVLLGTLGSAVLAASVHFASFFLGLEILSVSLYALIAYRASDRRGIEAGLKYLVLAGASAAFLLFGMALIYSELGTLEFARIAALIESGAPARPIIWLTGVALIITGVGFKLALVPFHLWTPDVYQGAPAPVAAFVATASKTGVLAVLLRFVIEVRGAAFPQLVLAISLIAGFSMSFGNLLALLQTNVKRILGYSSIAHLGYLLVAVTASGALATEAVGYYLATYVVTMLMAFGVIAALSNSAGEAEELEDFRGLFWSRPWLAAVLTAALLSLSAIPLTGGFVGKFYIVAAGAASSRWALLVILAVNSAIGLYYYLRIIVVMYSMRSEAAPARAVSLAPAKGLALALLVGGLLWLGLYPAPIVRALRSTSAITTTASSR